MEMKRLGTILSGLCLLFALSVSSVAVAAPCDTCAKCDQDGDTLIRESSFCQRKCGPATDTNDEPPGMCPVDGGGTVTKYTVTLTGNMGGVSATDGWSTSKSGNKWINLQTHIQPMTLDLSFFTTAIAGGDTCFPAASSTNLFAATISQRNIRGGIKQAEAGWWFVAQNKDLQSYNYVLQIFGIFPQDTVWPGGVTLDMVNWEMNDASGNGETTQTACIDEGVFNTTIVVE